MMNSQKKKKYYCLKKLILRESFYYDYIHRNPATIMTDEVSADFIYLKPLTIQSIEEILQERQIDCVLPTMGGQTALNLCKEAS